MTLIIKNRYALSQTPVSGGMAEVYQAFDTINGQKVAVKLFKAGEFSDEISEEIFKRETNALKDLRHKNIVGILDAGFDEEKQRHFIILEWVDSNLSQWLESNTLGGWDDFYDQIGKPVLDALCYAHEHQWVHRDLKPANILVTNDNIIKITDFGIAKAKNNVEPGITLANYGTEPFTPPEYDDGLHSYSRDVFSFGVLALRCLCEKPFKKHSELKAALEDFDAIPEISRIIENSISFNPEDRPIDALSLFLEIDGIQKIRKRGFEPARTCYLRLHYKAEEDVRKIIGGTVTSNTINSFILNDLKSLFGIKSQIANPENDTPQEVRYEIYSEDCKYIVAVDKNQQNHLVVLRVYKQSQVIMEKISEDAWVSEGKLIFQINSPVNNEEAKNTISYIQAEVDRHERELEFEKRDRAEQKLLDTWEKILRAKTEFEKNYNESLSYNGFHISGSRVTFTLATVPPEGLLGQSRIIKTPQGDVRGEIESVQGQDIVLYLQTDSNPNLLTKSGKLEFDNRAADSALRRQREALDSIRFQRCVNQQLRDLIVHPENSLIPKIITDISFVNNNLDEAKKYAVQKALGIEDFLIVEGPPGTGKTTFIAELVVQTLRQNPDLRILLTSQTHVALDNAITGISKLSPELRIVRVVSQMGGAKVEGIAKDYRVENLMRTWQAEAIKSGKIFLEKFVESKGIEPDSLTFGHLLKELIIFRNNLSREKAAKQQLDIDLGQVSANEIDGVQSSSETTRQVTEDLNTELKKVSSNIKVIEKHIKEIENELINLNELGKELILESNDELNEWVDEYLPNTPEIKQYLELKSIHANWKDRFGSREEFEVALISTAQVIASTCLGVVGRRGYQDISYDLCIVDEASKATPTEVLIPLSRSKKWILVGDQKQLSPFQDPDFINSDSLKKNDLREDEVKETLFDHLIKFLPDESKTALTVQHRMVTPIGNLVSQCFYDGRLQNDGPEIDKTLNLIFPKPVTWFTTSGLSNPHETKTGLSFINQTEAAHINKILGFINSAAKMANRNYTVALIAGYIGQKKEIERRIANNRDSWLNLKIDCNTVDAFQGREAEIVLYSVTRSNPFNQIGFLRVMERINVALSRGQFYLGIVGDHFFCGKVEGINPFRVVADHLNQNPNDCYIKELK